MPDNQENFINRPAVALGLPKTPIVPQIGPYSGPDGNGSIVGKELSVNDMFLAGLSKIKPQGVSEIPMSSVYTGERYTETRPGTDYEEMAAQQQSAFDKWRNSLAKLVGVAGTSFVSGTAGLVWGITSMFKDQRLASLIDNEVTRGADNIMAKFEDYAPNYYKHSEQDAEWYSPDNILTANFWSDKVLKNLGYSVGAIGGGIAWSKLFQKIGITNALVKAGQGMEAAKAVEDAMATAPKLQKYAAFENALNSVAQKYVKTPLSTILKDSDRILTSTMGTFGEASMEGLQNMNDFRKKAIQDYVDKYGKMPTGKDLEEINTYADKVGMYTWGFNSLLLTGTNYIQLPKILGSSRKAEKALINDIEQKALGEEFKQIVPETKFGKIAQTITSPIKSILKGKGTLLFAPSEAFEEGAQYAIQTGVNDYFKRAKDNKEEVNSFLANLSGSMGNVFGEGVDRTLSSKEGLESILIGGISGGLQQIRGTIKEQGIFGMGGEKKENTDIALSALNKTNIKKVLQDGVNYLGIGIGSQKIRQEAIKNNDKFTEKNSEQDFILSYVMPRVKYGKVDSVKQELSYYESQAMNDDGFDQLVRAGIANEKETKEQFVQRISNLKQIANNVDSLYTAINDKYGGLFDEKGEKIYSDDVVDRLVYAASKVTSFDERIPDVNATLLKFGIVTQDAIDSVLKDEKLDGEKVKETISKIDELNTDDDTKIDLKNNLNDLIKLSLSRKNFIKEYNEIRANPEKYKTVEKEKEIKKEKSIPGETIDISTKNKKKTFEVGKEYIVGNLTELGKDKTAVQRPSKLTIVGENTDGTIKVKLDNGEIKDMSKEYLLDHNLVKADVGDKLSKFLSANLSSRFIHKGIKNKEGKAVEGTIKWDDVNNTLVFQYINDKGTLIGVPIKSSLFQPSKGYKTGIIERIGESTAEQKATLDDLTDSTLSPANIREFLFDRKKIVADLVTKSNTRLDEVNKQLEKGKERLNQIKEGIEKAHLTKKGTPRKNVNDIAKIVKSLSAEKISLEKTMDVLQEEKESLEGTVPYLQAILDDIDSMPEGFEDAKVSLKKDIDDLETIIENTKGSIKTNESLLKDATKAYEKALDILNDWIKRVKEENPNIPLTTQDLEDRLERFYGPEGARRLMEERGALAEDLLTLQDQIDTFSEELKIPDLSKKLDELFEDANNLNKQLDDLINQQIVKADLLKTFENAVREYEDQIKQEKQISSNKKFADKILATNDKTSQRNIESDATYEADRLKPENLIPLATVASPDIPGYERSIVFGMNLESFPNRDQIRGVYITSKNEKEFGLFDEDKNEGLTKYLAQGKDKLDKDDPEYIDPEKTIVFVMVEKGTDGVLRLVDQNGKILEKGVPTIENAIYQVMPSEKLKYGPKYKNRSMFREGTPENVIKTITAKYKAWRDETLANPKDTDYEIEASFGTPKYVGNLDDKNVFQRNYDAVVPVEKAGLVTSKDLVQGNVMYIPTTSGDAFKGSTKYKNALGRVFLSLNNAYVKLTNRNFSKEKAETIYQAIERLADNFFSSIDKDTEELSAERVRLQNWLKSVIYWGTPKDINGKRKEAGYNSIWYESVKTDDPIFKTQIRLFFGKNEESISFTPNQVRANKEQIINLLHTKLYPNANSTMIKGGKGINWNDTYEEILSISPDGTITSREWKNYQSYLLSDKFIAADKNNPENGKSREDVPFFTQIQPKENKNDINRENIYFSRKAIGDEFSVPVEKAKTKGSTITKTITAGAPTVKKEEAPKKKAPVKKEQPSKTVKYDLTGKTVNTFTIPEKTDESGNVIPGYTFDFMSIGDKLIGKMENAEKIIASNGIKLMNTDNNKDAIKRLTEAAKGDKKRVTQSIFAKIYNELLPSIKEYEKELEDEFVGPMMFSVEDEEFDDVERKSIFGKKTKEEKEDDESEAPFVEETTEEEEEEPEVKNELINRLKQRSKGKSNLRKIIKERIENFKSEDWIAFEEWMSKNFPNIPVYRVKNIIQGMGGAQGYGMFHKGALYILQNAEIGTGFHEVFHPIWKAFTTPKERKKISKEFKNREGSFFDRITEKTIQYKDADIDQVEEQLAEEFREYMLYGKIPIKPKDNRPFILKLFSDLLSYIRKFITGKDSKTNTEKLFEKIKIGEFKNSYSPYASELSYANKGILEIDEVYGDESSKLRKKFTGENIHDIMQQMTYELLRGIVANNESLFKIPDLNKGEEYKRLKIDIENTALETARIAKEIIEEGGESIDEKTLEGLKKEIANSIHLWKNIRDNWNELITKHEEYLRSYSIQFDENDNLQLTDETNTGREDYQDSRKMDNFRKMNSAIKLLLATLPIVDENNDIEVSSIGGVKLLPMSEVYIKIMNNVYTSRNPDEMIDRLHKMAQDDLNYRRLFTRLTGSANFDNNDVTFTNIDSTHQLQLISSFYRTFKKQNPDVKNVYIFENGDVEIGDSNFATAARQVMEKYENNIRKIIKAEKNPYFEYSKDKNAYIGKQGVSRRIDLSNTRKQVEFLKDLGIEFKQSEIENLSKNRRKAFNEAVSGIKTSIANADRIATINAKVLDINNNLLSLSLIRAQIDNPEFDSTFFNVTGERMQAFIGPNAASEFNDMLSQINSLNELKGTQFEYLLTDSFAQESYILGQMFDLESEGKERIKDSEQLMIPGYADGMIDVGKGKKKPSDKLNYRERLIQQINLNLKGFFLTLVPGDSATEHMQYMGTAVTEADIVKGFKKLHRIFKGYLISEINLSRENRKIKETESRKTTDLRFFKNILNSELHNKIVNDTETDPEKIYNDYEDQINEAVETYIKKKGASFKNTLLTYSIIKKGEKEGTFDVESLYFAKDKGVSDADINRHMTALAANFAIANIELHKLLFSDPYQYSDELKRIKNFLSPGQAIVHGSPNMNAAYNRVHNEGYEEGKIGWTNFDRDHFRAATMDDVWAIDEILKYSPYEEANGSGIIIQTAHRNFRIRAGEWNDNEELQFRYDIAWEKRDKGKDLSDAEIKLLENGNPEVRSAYTPVKPIGRGNKANGREYNDVLLDKFALYPLSYRVMKQLNNDANIIKLYDKMQRDDVDYVVFESGRKVGAEKLTAVYNSKGEFNDKPFQTKAEKNNPELPQAVINVPFSIFYIQTEVPSKDDGDATRGSQTTKLVTMDYMEAGVPIDFIHEKSTDFTPERYEAWMKLSPEQKEEQSPLYKEIVNNQKLLQQITENGYRSLLKKLGIKEISDDEFEVEDFSKMGEVLRDEILKREVNVNISDALNDFLNGNTTIEATPAYQQIRNILYSIADKNVISPKITGGMKVQITSTMLESVRAKPKQITTKDGKKKTVFTSDVLKFYRNKDGKRVCQIYLARWFDSNKTDEQLLNEWYTTDDKGERILTEEGRKILSGLAFRIPTQRQNSIDSFEIAGFLPREFGDSVIIPSQLVEKAGSDFDIDKLSLYLKNVFTNKNGETKAVEFLTDENSTPEERYVHWVRENSNRDTRRYVRFLSRENVQNLRTNFEIEAAKIDAKYKQFRKIDREELFQDMQSEIESQKNVKLSVQDSYMQELFEIGKKVFWRMDDITRESFWAVRDDIRRRDIKGPEEIRRYLALATAMVENPNTIERDVVSLKSLMKIYEEELRVMGVMQETIDGIVKDAIASFRENKNNLEVVLKMDKSKEFRGLGDIYEDAKSQQSFEGAQEIANIDGLASFDEFRNFSKYQQNVKDALQNAYIQSCINLVSNELNFANLTKPNSAKQLKDLATKITNKLGIGSFDYSSTDNLLSMNFMSRLRHAFVSGKYAIGIAATAQTNHSQNQRGLIYLDANNFNKLSEEDKYWITGGTMDPKDITIKFQNYNKIKVNNKDVATLSMIKNADMQYISDLISQFIDGYVDISKGPWIMELGAASNVAGTWLFLVKMGVPIDDVAFFMNQPIIRDYLRSIENAGYSWLFIDDIVEKTKLNYTTNLRELKKVTSVPSTDDLFETIGKSKFTPKEAAEQQFILDEFLKYAKMANHLFLMQQGSNYDTANFNDPLLIFKKEMALEQASKTIFTSSEGPFQNSFVKTIRENLLKLRKAFSKVLMSDQLNVRSIIQETLTPYLDLPDREFVKVGRMAIANLFDYAVQTDRKFNQDIKNILLSDKNVADEIQTLVNNSKRKSNALHNNPVMKALTTIENDRSGVNNIKIKNKDNKTYDQNQLIYGFNELKDYLISIDRESLYDRLVQLAVLQSGLTNSPISFTALLPYVDFKKMYNETLSKLDSIKNLTSFGQLKVFQRNNWADDDIVPRRKAQLKFFENEDGKPVPYYNSNMRFSKFPGIQKAINNGDIPQVLRLDIRSREAYSDTLVYTWENEDYSIAERKKMKKEGDWSFINKGLFQKVKVGNDYLTIKDAFGNPQYVYKAINAWGDSFRANEFYTFGKKSVIDNGFIKVDEVSDNIISQYFFSSFEENPISSQPKRTGSTVTRTISQPTIKEEDFILNSPADTTSLLLKMGAKKVSKGALNIDGQYWYLDSKYWKTLGKVGRTELFLYPNPDAPLMDIEEVYVGKAPTGSSKFTTDVEYYKKYGKPTQTEGEIAPKGKPAIKDQNQNNCG